MKRFRLILILTLILVGCKPVDIIEVHKFYRENYFKNESNQRFLKNDERARNTIFNTYFNDIEKKNDITVVIEYFKYPNGNFDILNTEAFFYQNDSIVKAYYLKSNRKSKIEDITNDLVMDTKKTNELILELLAKGEFKKLSQLHKKSEYSVSDAGKIYVTFLDNNFDVLQGYVFKEFMVSVPFKFND